MNPLYSVTAAKKGQNGSNLLPLKNQLHVKNKLNNIKLPNAPRVQKEELRSLQRVQDTRKNDLNLSNIINMTEAANEVDYKNRLKKSKNKNNLSVNKMQLSGQVDLGFYNPSDLQQSLSLIKLNRKQ